MPSYNNIPFLVTKGKTKLMKGKVERIIMVPAGGSKAKRYLCNRNGRISLALGDMAAVYFVSVAAIVAAFYGKEAYTARKKPEAGKD